MTLSTKIVTTSERIAIKHSDKAKALTIDKIWLSRLESSLSGGIENQVPLSEFVEMLKNGASGSVLKQMTEFIPKDIVVKAIRTDKTNFAKLYKKQLTRRQTDEINDLSALWCELMVFFDWDKDDVMKWIGSPISALEENDPASLMNTFFGRNKIRECLEVMRYGDFA